jgi:ABC-type nitrate/sulfonate/bicarbonate transport system permease component
MSVTGAQMALPASRVGSAHLKTMLQRVALALLFLALWQAASSTVPGYLFPGPLQTWDAFLRIWKDGSIGLQLGVTMYRVTVGFVIAALIGVPLGILLGSSKTVGEFFSPVLPVMNSVSSAIWSLIAVVWFGLSDMTPIFVCLMTGLPLIVTNVWQGTRNVNAEWLELARSVRMPAHKVFWKIYIPAILPFFFSGARLAFGFGARVSLVAEALGSSAGVGYMIVRSADLLQMSNVFAWSILLVGTIAAVDGLIIRPTEAFLFRWRKEA